MSWRKTKGRPETLTKQIARGNNSIQCVKTGRLLLLRRIPNADFAGGEWEYITGRIKQFEEPFEGLKREVQEEAGIALIHVVKPITLFHIFRGKEKTAENELVGIVYACETETEDVRISGEHTEFRWLRYEEALKLITHPGIKADLETWKKLK